MEERAAERRQAPRYALRTDFYLAFRPGLDRVGRIKDVSRSGAAFEYPVYDEYHQAAAVEVDIFAPEAGCFLLLGVPCQVVYDVGIDHGTESTFQTRRCGLRFDRLSVQHRDQLQLLLGKFASPRVSCEPTVGRREASALH